jgi:hypothetical protein
MKNALIAAACLAPLFLMSAPAIAGRNDTSVNTGQCFVEPNLIQGIRMTTCRGTMAGIRNQTTDGDRAANFFKYDSGSLLFSMWANGQFYSCTAPSSLNETWTTVINANAWFNITFDRAAGLCYFLVAGSGSSLKNASAL